MPFGIPGGQGVSNVQAVPIVPAPTSFLPRVAGEDEGRGLNGAQRLIGLNDWNSWNDSNYWNISMPFSFRAKTAK
jgi:hypothetical protein